MISFGGWNFVDNLCNNGPSIKKLKNDLMKTKKKTFLDNPLLFLLQYRYYLIYISEIWKKIPIEVDSCDRSIMHLLI